MSTTVRIPVSCDEHDVTALLGAEHADKSRHVIGLHCVDCDAIHYAEESCPDCHEVAEHSSNCQMNWVV
jgi:uncharacterized paraquat-inducible protein A